MRRRVVIYDYVSTEHKAQLSSLENQLDWYKPIPPDNDKDVEIVAMTAENLETDEKMDNHTEKSNKIFAAVYSLISWIIELLAKIFKLG